MPYFFSESITKEKNAGNKARKDVENIFSLRGYKKVNYVRSLEKSKIKQKIQNFMLLNKSLKEVPKDEILYIQYPFMSGGNTLLPYISKKRKVAIIIHDLDSLRMTEDTSKIKKQIKSLANCKYIIAQNSRMIKLLIDNGIKKSIIYNLKLFDYLTTTINERQHYNDSNAICFSGNLKKSDFIYEIKKPLSNIGIKLYGNGLDTKKIDNSIKYEGAYEPDQIHLKLKGKFGLVWDGTDINTCSGLIGKYLKYNDPHKISMYIVAGLPVIIWDKAAEAEFIKKNNIGITVSSLNDLPKILSNFDKEKYLQLRKNVFKVASKIAKGYFLNKQLDLIEGK